MTTRREFLTETIGVSIFAAACVERRRPLINVSGRSLATSNTVETVLGPIDVSRLGFTLAHEHICYVPPERRDDRAGAVRYMVGKLKAAKDAGIDSIVDTTTFDVGRDVQFGQEVSRRSGVHLVVSTGQHVFAPEELSARSVEEIAEVFIQEIDNGIENTNIKAGAIKVAARSEAMSPAEINVFRAAARAHTVTGVPIQTHTNARRRAGERQAELFESEGVSPARVAFGHSDDAEDSDYLIGLASRGYALGMDHAFFGVPKDAVVSFHRHVESIKNLVDKGFVDRILISTDWELGAREQLNPAGLLFVTGRTIPYLIQLGLAENHVRAMTVEHPARFFARG